jgi:UDP:flavonoid glycosyltransferase YjiC (YdhE family)
MVGHINPAVSVADELRARGHQVAWAGDDTVLRSLLSEAEIYPCELPAFSERPAALRGFSALKYLWEEVLTPMAEEMAPGVLDAVTEFNPDLLVVDQ